MTTVTRIIGIDPGLRHTGWGVVDSLGNSVRFVASGSVNSNGDLDLASRLVQIHDGLDAVLHQYQPDEAAVEITFVNKDAGATLKLGQARGVALLVPAKRGLPVAEYAPKRGEEGDRRRGTRGERADPRHGQGADAEGHFRQRRRGRRAGHRADACPSSRFGGGAIGQADGWLTDGGRA